MSIVIEPQILDVTAVKPVNVDIQSGGNAQIDVSTVASHTVGIATAASSNNYNALNHKPQINGITLEDNKTSEDLNIVEDKTYFYIQSVASNT